MNIYEMSCDLARKRGAIGIFYKITDSCGAVDAGMAAEIFRYRYETQGPPVVVTPIKEWEEEEPLNPA